MERVSIDNSYKKINDDISERGQSLERTVEWREGGIFFFKQWKYLRMFKCYQEGSSTVGEIEAAREGAASDKVAKEA